MSDYQWFDEYDYWLTRDRVNSQTTVATLRYLPAHAVVSWLDKQYDTHKQSKEFDVTTLETSLFSRNEPLIDMGLARYSRDIHIGRKLLSRLDHLGRCVLFRYNRNASSFIPGDDTLPSDELFEELACAACNPYQPSEYYISILDQKNAFSLLNEDDHARVVACLLDNVFFTNRYNKDRLFEEGIYENYDPEICNALVRLSGRCKTSDWQAKNINWLFKLVETTKDFPPTELLRIIDRWYSEDTIGDSYEYWYESWPSFLELRFNLAYLISDAKQFENSIDPALRLSYYRRSQEILEKDWTDFLEKDGKLFIVGILENGAIWKEKEYIKKLSEFLGAMDDKSAYWHFDRIYQKHIEVYSYHKIN